MAEQRLFKTVNGHKWAYLRHGKGKIPIFLIHGMLNYADYLIDLANSLGNEFDVIIPDLPASGFSPSIKPINNFSTITRDFNSFIKSFDYPKISFFGTSLGGGVILETAISNPKIIDYMFLHSPLWKWSEVCLKNPLEKFEVFVSQLPPVFLKIMQNKPTAKTVFNYLSIFEPKLKKFPSEVKDKIWESFSLLDVEGTLQLFKSTKDINLENKFRNLNVKTILLSGKEDKVIPLESTKKLAQLIKNLGLGIFTDHGHEAIVSAPDKLAKIIRMQILENKKAEEQDLIWETS